MKTIAKKLTVYGNLAIVQFRMEPQARTEFRPGAPEMKKGKLIISESTGSGVVGRLIAINNTGDLLLLTDADILIGAKQNRVLNSSVLLAPYSKTALEVTCIERLRWHYVSEKFSTPGTLAEHDLRKEKARSLAPQSENPEFIHSPIQNRVWSFIHHNLAESNCKSATESYADLINYKMLHIDDPFPECEPENECNGMAVILNKKVISADIFGREDVYRYYFHMLRDSAYRIRELNRESVPVNEDEAFYRVLEFIDGSENPVRHPGHEYTGAGNFQMFHNTDLVGQELKLNEELVHTAIFGK